MRYLEAGTFRIGAAAAVCLLLLAIAPQSIAAQEYDTTIVATSGSVFSGLTIKSAQRPSVNNSGEVVFLATLPSGHGVVSSTRGILARTGQTIDGYRIVEIYGTPFINNHGDVAFAAEIDNPDGFTIFVNNQVQFLPGDLIGGKIVGRYRPDLISLDDHGIAFFQVGVQLLFTQHELVLELPTLAESSLEGALSAVGSTIGGRTLEVISDNSLTPHAFAVYRAPVDFTADDDSTSAREISIRVIREYGTIETITVPIVRPPVVLVHGYAVDASSWEHFSALRADDSPFTVFAADYGWKLAGTPLELTSATPHLNADRRLAARRSHLGFTVNTPIVAAQVKGFIKSYRLGANPWAGPIASVKADIVAHSMGGLVIRNWTNDDKSYYAPENFGEGFVHKLITLGTPHFGSPQAIVSLAAASECSRDIGAIFGRQSFTTAVTRAGTTVAGAAGELMGDGIGVYLSPALLALNAKAPRVPMAMLAGDVTPILTNVDASAASFVVATGCPDDPLASRYTSAAFATLFDPLIRPGNLTGDGTARISDGSVPLTSALMDAGVESCLAGVCFSRYAHGEGTAAFFNPGIAPAHPTNFLVDDSTAIFERLVKLLNASVLDAETWR